MYDTDYIDLILPLELQSDPKKSLAKNDFENNN